MDHTRKLVYVFFPHELQLSLHATAPKYRVVRASRQKWGMPDGKVSHSAASDIVRGIAQTHAALTKCNRGCVEIKIISAGRLKLTYLSSSSVSNFFGFFGQHSQT